MALTKFTEFVKDPNAVLDYEWDWTEWLEAIDDTIDTVEFIASADGVTVESFDHNGTKAIAWISGGVSGKPTVTCRITTTGERVDDRTFAFKIVER